MPERRANSLAAEAAFQERLRELGGELLEGTWLGAHGKHHVRCSAGHDCYPTPHGVSRGYGICLTCANMDPVACEARFRARLAELGAAPLYTEWRGTGKPHAVRCAAGHECFPRPSDVRRGHGICITCAGKDPQAAEAAFRERLAELGAVPLYETWLGTNRPHHIRCAAGHDCYSRPAHLRDGGGVCRACVGHDPATAEAAFRARLIELGATPLYGAWLGVSAAHHVRCHAGHDCYPRPANAQRWGICRVCVGRDPNTAEMAFRSRLAELGAELLEPKWLGALQKHLVRDAAGHDCYVRPNQVQQGYGICLICANRDPATAAAAFRASLAEAGAILLEPEWLGTSTPHRVECPQGHLCRPTPANISQGHGICRFCAGSDHDAFYVVTGTSTVKFGITTGNGRHRLMRHAGAGYPDVVRLVTDLPGTVALDTENAVKAALSLAAEVPVSGREYFDISCLALILDVADGWLAPLERPSTAC